MYPAAPALQADSLLLSHRGSPIYKHIWCMLTSLVTPWSFLWNKQKNEEENLEDWMKRIKMVTGNLLLVELHDSYFYILEKEMQPTPVFLPGESHRQRSLAGSLRPWGRKSRTWFSALSHLLLYLYLCFPNFYKSFNFSDSEKKLKQNKINKLWFKKACLLKRYLDIIQKTQSHRYKDKDTHQFWVSVLWFLKNFISLLLPWAMGRKKRGVVV